MTAIFNFPEGTVTQSSSGTIDVSRPRVGWCHTQPGEGRPLTEERAREILACCGQKSLPVTTGVEDTFFGYDW